MLFGLEKIAKLFTNSDMSRRQLTALIFSSTVALLLEGLRRIAHGYQRLKYYPIRSIEGTQSFDPTTWRLKVDGLVENAEAFTYEEILQLPKMTQIKNFVCVEGWGLDRQKWEGIHLRQIFEKVRVSPAARFVTFHAIGGKYTDSLTLDEALEPETMLAYRLNDGPLDPQQGKPLRLIVPRMYGYKGVKWVERITLEEEQHVGYWERRGYPVDGSIRQ